MRKCLSFIGIRPLIPATYLWNDQEYTTPVIQKALSCFYPFDQIILFVTREAEVHNLLVVRDELIGNDIKIVRIANGGTEQEIWEIFSLISEEVNPEDEILFDITHAFRFLPFLAFLSATYIREITGARLIGVVYGAFDAGKDEPGKPRRTPVFDLTPFISLVDWMMAVRSFISFGDARGMRTLIDGFVTNTSAGAIPGINTGHLTALAEPLRRFTTAVQLAQPLDGMEAAYQVMQTLPGARDEVETLIPPLNPVLSRISALDEYATPNPRVLTRKHLDQQLGIIIYQVEKGLYIQAAELAREWMVSAIIFAMGDGKQWLDEPVRTQAEELLRDLGRKKRGQSIKLTKYLKKMERNPRYKDLAGTWTIIAPLRNDLAHCGMHEHAPDTRELEAKILRIPGQLREFLDVLMVNPDGTRSDPG